MHLYRSFRERERERERERRERCWHRRTWLVFETCFLNYVVLNNCSISFIMDKKFPHPNFGAWKKQSWLGWAPDDAMSLCWRMAISWKCNISSPLLVYSGTWIRQTKYILMMTKEWSTKIVNLLTPGAGVLMLMRGHISQNSEYASSSSLLIYSILIAIVVLRDWYAASQCHCWFLFILWWGCWYANMNTSNKKSVKSLWYSGDH